MDGDFCEACGLITPHPESDCFKELVRKKKIGDEMFDRAIKLIHKLGDPVDPKNKDIENEIVALDVETWRWAS